MPVQSALPAAAAAAVAAALCRQTMVIRAEEGTRANLIVRRDNGIIGKNANGEGGKTRERRRFVARRTIALSPDEARRRRKEIYQEIDWITRAVV